MKLHPCTRGMLAVLTAAASLIAVTEATTTASASPPPYVPCPDPSGLCPPTDSYPIVPRYTWAGSATGAQWSDEFSGTTLNSSIWFKQDSTSVSAPPGGCANLGKTEANGGVACDSWWSPAQVSVSGDELHLGTGWASTDTACKNWWSTDLGVTQNGCWVSGGIGQNNGGTGGESWLTDGQFVVEAKLTGTNPITHLDSVAQVGAYPTWPPEIDYWESDVSSSYSVNLHCVDQNPANPGGQTQDQTTGISATLTTWETYEMDWTPSTLKFYLNGTLVDTVTEGGSSTKCQDGSGAPSWNTSNEWPNI